MMHSEITGCSFALGANCNHVFYFSVDHKDTKNLDKQVVLDLITHIEDLDIPMTAANILFEGTITKVQLGHTLKYHWDTTRLLHHHIDENDEHGLKHLSKRYLDYTQATYKDTLEAHGASNMSELTGEQTLDYGCDDSLVTAYLHNLFTWTLKLKGNYDFIINQECPAAQAFVKAHVDGVALDSEKIKELSEEDEKVMNLEMIKLRQLLSENCKNPNELAVDKLYQDQAPYIKAKETDRALAAGETQKEIQASVKSKLESFRKQLQDGSYYQSYIVDTKPAEFSPTVKQLTAVTEKLGLPPYEKTTMIYVKEYCAQLLGKDETTPDVVEDYLLDCNGEYTEDQKKFLRLLGPASTKSWKMKSSEEYLEFVTFCAGILDLPPTVTTQGTELNVDSPKQMQYFLYLLLGVEIRARTEPKRDSLRYRRGLEGSPGTDEYAMQMAIANDCLEQPWKKEVLESMMAYKDANTRRKNYWNVYPLWLQGSTDGLIHPGFNSCGTVTRRPTGSNPNLMQIAKGDVREIFVPRSKDNVLVSMDFSSQELRLTADRSGDKTFMDAYLGEVKKDVHAIGGTGILSVFMRSRGVKLDDYPDLKNSFNGQFVDYNYFLKVYKDPDHELNSLFEDSRYAGKTTNFLGIYGGGYTKLSASIGCTLDEAKAIMQAQDQVFPGVNAWKEMEIKQARVVGYSQTSYGNYRHLPGIKSSDRAVSSRWERQAVNAAIQGTAADILKIVLTEMCQKRILERYDAYLIATVYDEILCEVPIKHLHPFFAETCQVMDVTPPGHKIPMVADCSFGRSWAKQIEIGEFPKLKTVNEALEKL